MTGMEAALVLGVGGLIGAVFTGAAWNGAYDAAPIVKVAFFVSVALMLPAIFRLLALAVVA
jgi:hypothetical protein